MLSRPDFVKKQTVEQLVIEVYSDRQDMGLAAACDVAARISQLLASQDRVRMVFAAAPSQNEFLQALSQAPDIDWKRVSAFHMDEYIGLPATAPQGFGNFLRTRLFGLVNPGQVEYINGNALDAEAECIRYSSLVNAAPIDIVCAGIGENGHMAFNDPPVADFDDPATLKLVELDDVCRMQQVHDGAFPTFDDVPEIALTMTMSALMSARWVYCMVPGPTKTEAVTRTIKTAVSTECPATIMRKHAQATLYVDRDAAAGL